MNRHSPRQGSALLMVFWAVMVMSVCVLGLVGYLYSVLDDTITLKKDARAHQLAQSGVAIGMNPAVSRDDPILKQTVAPGEGFEVHLRSEGGRLNINRVLQNQEWVILGNVFREWGLDEADMGNLLNAFQNWSSPKSGTVAAATGNGQNQPHIVRLFESVDDMLTIPGMDQVALVKPDWRDYFTVWSDGPLDMNDAPAELISAVCGVGSERAEQFVNVRLGPDGKMDTEDDVIFKNLDEVRAQLGMSTEQFAGIKGLLSVQDSTSRIESTGILGTYQRKIMVVVRRSANPPVFLQWQEL